MLECKICNKKMLALASHLTTHNITSAEYKLKYNVEQMVSIGSSIWHVEYWIKKGMNRSEAIEKVHSLQTNNSIKACASSKPKHIWTVKYWLSKGLSESEAKSKISELQSKNSIKSTKFAGHKHTEETKKQIRARMKEVALEIGHDILSSRFYGHTPSSVSNIENECLDYIESYFDIKLVRNESILGKYFPDGLIDNLIL